MPSCLYNQDVAACRATLKANSKTFHAASLLLPARVRAPASVLYGFCRLADDAVDVDGGNFDAVDQLRQRLDRVYAGRPEPVAEDRALAAVVAEFGIPRQMPDFLLEGLAWDVEGRRYESLDDLLAYAARVAGAVGAMMSLLMGVREPAALARACELGVAMQLSNIARDVGEDARMGRLYLPRSWMVEAGLDPDVWLRNPQFDARLAQVVQRLLAEAETLYARVGAGVAELPLGCRPGINAARFMYAEIGRELLRRGADSVSQRTVVPGRRKAMLLLRAALALRPSKSALQAASLTVNQPLIDAAVQAMPPRRSVDNVTFVIDLFERLERRDRAPKGIAA